MHMCTARLVVARQSMNVRLYLFAGQLRNGHVITYRFIISLSKPSLNEPQSEKHSHSPAMLEFCLNRSI